MAGTTHHHRIQEWETQIAMGHVPGMEWVNKFGQNPVIGATREDLWPLGGTHTYLTSGTTLNLTSDNVNDTTQIIWVTGLDANWDNVTAWATLTGTTPVQIGTALNWTHIQEIWQVSAEPACLGDVYVAIDGASYTAGIPDTLAEIQGYVDFKSTASPNTTQQCFTIVPRHHQGLIYNIMGVIGPTGGSASEVALEVSELANNATVDNPSWMPWRKLADLTLTTTAGVQIHSNFKAPILIEELSRVRLSACTTSDSVVGGGITSLMVPTGELPTPFTLS